MKTSHAWPCLVWSSTSASPISNLLNKLRNNHHQLTSLRLPSPPAGFGFTTGGFCSTLSVFSACFLVFPAEGFRSLVNKRLLRSRSPPSCNYYVCKIHFIINLPFLFRSHKWCLILRSFCFLYTSNMNLHYSPKWSCPDIFHISSTIQHLKQQNQY
jgi:hypothetical protein